MHLIADSLVFANLLGLIIVGPTFVSSTHFLATFLDLFWN